MLFVTGAVSRKGSIKDGNTVGDSAAESRDRQMSVEVSAACTEYNNLRFTFIDCPGSVEFAQETYNALMGVDAAIVVCEPITDRVLTLAPLFKFLDDWEIPHLVFVNKMDRANINVLDTLHALKAVSSRPLVAHQYPIIKAEQLIGFIDLVSEEAYKYHPGAPADPIPFPEELKEEEHIARAEMLEALANFDDHLLRPAAIDQLKVLGEQIGVEVYSEPENKNAVQIAENALKEARSKNKNVIIVDTAGRLAIDETMMTEVANIKSAVKPQEILFVVDSMTGQDAVNTAKAFNDRLDFTGVVLTKLDGDTRGGAALSIKYTVNKPIKFVSSGEKMDTLDVFYPERMAQRILGMGDITSLVEKAQAQFDEEQAKKLEKKIRKNQFDFEDFKQQLDQIKKMGNLKDLTWLRSTLNRC
ncbi:hypothetical protein NUACC21_00180 [Scytonema sp. NUACC21]